MITYFANMKSGEMNSTVGQRGQVTVPKKLRDRLGIRPGVVVEFEETKGGILLRKKLPEGPMDAVYGIVACDRSTDDLMVELRGLGARTGEFLDELGGPGPPTGEPPEELAGPGASGAEEVRDGAMFRRSKAACETGASAVASLSSSPCCARRSRGRGGSRGSRLFSLRMSASRA